MSMIPVGSPEAQGAIARVKARMAAEALEHAIAPAPGKTEWPVSSTYVAMKQRGQEAAQRRAEAPDPEPKPLTRTQRLNSFVRERYLAAVEERGEVNMTVLDAEIVDALIDSMKDDPDFRAVIEAAIRPTVHDIGFHALKKAGHVQIQGANAITIDALRQKVKVKSERVAWLEYDPDQKIHIALHEMTRSQVLAAAMNRTDQAREHKEIARWLLRIADRLPDDATTVGQALTDDELIRLRGLTTSPSPVKGR
jgi:hypothetical protein